MNNMLDSLPEGFVMSDSEMLDSLPEGFVISPSEDNSRETISKLLQTSESLPEDFVAEDPFGGKDVPLDFSLANNTNNQQVEVPAETITNDNAVTQPDESKFNAEAVSEEQIGQGAVAGAARLPLGMYYIGEGLYNKLTDSDKHQAEVYIQNNKQFIEDNNLKGPALVGEMFAGSLLGGFVTKTALTVGLSAGATETVAGIGAGRSKEEIAIGAGAAFLLGAGGTILINKLIDANPLSQAAGYMKALDSGKITEEEFSKLIVNVPKDEQAILLAEGDVVYKKLFKNVVAKHNKTAANLGKRLAVRKQIIDKYAASEADMNKAIEDFGSMRKLVKEHAPDTFVTDGLKDNINAIDKIYRTDPTPVGTIVRNVLADTKGEIDIDTALDLTETINSIIRKPSVSKNAKGNLTNIKKSLDTFVSTSLKDKPNLLAIKDATINNYREVVNDYQLADLIKTHTKNDLAVDWKALDKSIKKNKIKSTNLDYAKPIIKDFSRRFVNDVTIASELPITGAKPNNLLGILGKLYTGVLDIGHRVLRTDRAHGLVIQEAIRKSINNPKNKYYDDFINDLRQSVDKNKRLPDDIKAQIDNYMEDMPRLPYKGPEGNTGDVNLNPLYSSPETGRVSDSMHAINSEDLIKDFVAKQSNVTDDVVSKAISLVNSKRYKDILNNTRAKLNVDDANKNKEILRNIVNTETKLLIERMEREIGIKLSREEANKIIMSKMKEIFDECK